MLKRISRDQYQPSGAPYNKAIEQDYRFIKKLTRQMKGFKSFSSASATLEGIEVAHMIRKRQFGLSGQSAFQQFAALAG
nr:DDE-type integrase/transposase/recombinase [Octadecabacter arcticus]